MRTNRASPSDLQAHIGYWMRSISNHVSHAFAQGLHQSGVTVIEWVVLRKLYDQEELSPSYLADQTGITRGAASKLLDRLIAKGLITRQGRSDDRRYQDIELTPAGRKLVPALAAIADRNDEACFQPLTGTERKTLLALLKKLAQAHSLQTIPTE